ncbi:hypothetical protein T09_921, partial [Trichinella sp. T9]
LSNVLDTPGLAITIQNYSPLTSETSDLLCRSLYSGPLSRIGGNNQSIVSKTEVRRAKLHGMIDQLTQLCKDASHSDDL